VTSQGSDRALSDRADGPAKRPRTPRRGRPDVGQHLVDAEDDGRHGEGRRRHWHGRPTRPGRPVPEVRRAADRLDGKASGTGKYLRFGEVPAAKDGRKRRSQYFLSVSMYRVLNSQAGESLVDAVIVLCERKLFKLLRFRAVLITPFLDDFHPPVLSLIALLSLWPLRFAIFCLWNARPQCYLPLYCKVNRSPKTVNKCCAEICSHRWLYKWLLLVRLRLSFHRSLLLRQRIDPGSKSSETVA